MSQVLMFFFYSRGLATPMCSLGEKCTELQLLSVHFSVCVIEIKTQDTQNAGLRPNRKQLFLFTIRLLGPD